MLGLIYNADFPFLIFGGKMGVATNQKPQPIWISISWPTDRVDLGLLFYRFSGVNALNTIV